MSAGDSGPDPTAAGLATARISGAADAAGALVRRVDSGLNLGSGVAGTTTGSGGVDTGDNKTRRPTHTPPDWER